MLNSENDGKTVVKKKVVAKRKPSKQPAQKTTPPKSDFQPLVEDDTGGTPKESEILEKDEDVELGQVEEIKYDIAFVVPKSSEKYMQEIKGACEAAGFLTNLFESVALTGDQAVQFMRIALPRERGQEFASATKCPGRLNPPKLKEACLQLENPISFNRKATQGRSFAEVTKINGYWPPFLYIFADFKIEKKNLFLPFVAHNYHKIQLRMLGGSEAMPMPVKGSGLNIREMDQCLPATNFPVDKETGEGPRIATIMLLHDALEDENSLRNKLIGDWILGGKYMHVPWLCPVHRIREYLGDQMGFYFLFTSTFASHTMLIAFVGFGLMIYSLATPVNEDKERQAPIVFFAPCTVLAMMIFMIHFKRKQANYAKEWGCFAWTASKLRKRKAFQGFPQVDPVDGTIVIDFSKQLRARRQAIAWGIITVLLILVLGIVSSIFGLQAYFINKPDDDFWHIYGPYLCTVLNVIQVQLLNFLYSNVAERLTLYENWKTDPEYSYNLIAKLFIFKFINTFASVYYVAFIKKHVETKGCDVEGGCLQELATTIMPIFLTGAAISFTTQLAIPLIKQRRIQMRTGGNYGDTSNEGDQVEMLTRRQFNELTEYDPIDGPIADCMQVVLDFGYLACFGAAFPASPFIALAMTTLKLKVDGYKMLRIHRRMICLEVCGIGVWEDIAYFIVLMSIPTSMGLMVFTSRVFDDDVTTSQKWVVFFMGSNLLYLALKALEKIFPAQSLGLRMQLKRQQVFNQRIVYGMQQDTAYDEADAEEDYSADASLMQAQHKNVLLQNI